MRSWLPTPGRKKPPSPKHRIPDPVLAHEQLRAAWQIISLLLEYPTEQQRELLPHIVHAASGLPGDIAKPLLRLCTSLQDEDLYALQSDYVATFDTTRRCALHLTYYVHGETRKRGVALVQFKQAFRKAGLEVNDAELPDHLCVVLEFGATGDVDIAWKLLNDHRVGIEMLQLGLDDKASRWGDAITALRATLPVLEGSQLEAVERLLAEGPPDEEVGLDGYALDPLLNPHPDSDPDSLFALHNQGASS